jgi:hypothetical protein
MVVSMSQVNEYKKLAHDAGLDWYEIGSATYDFAELVAQHERQTCIDLLMGLHEAQSNNGNHNYYHYAANAIKELRKTA